MRISSLTVVLSLAALGSIAWLAVPAIAGSSCCTPPQVKAGSAPRKVYGLGGNELGEPRLPEPYRGQRTCPVCQGKLGASNEPISVESTLTTPVKKTFWQKVGLAPASAEKLTYFVCGADCAAAAQKEPNQYLAAVIAGGKSGR